MRNSQIVINGLLINYFVGGKVGNERCLLFLHGWRSEAVIWNSVIEKIGDTAAAYAMDLPGFGKSQAPAQPFSVDDYCLVVGEFIQKLGLSNVCLVGHSFGGRIGIKLSATRPELVQNLVLVDSAGFPMGSVRKTSLGFAAKLVKPFFRPRFMQPLRKKIYRFIGAEDYVETPQLQKTFVNVVNEDLSEHLKNIHQPTVIVWGEHDADTPLEHAEKMKQGIANSELVVLPNAGHFSFVDQPEKFAEILQKVIS